MSKDLKQKEGEKNKQEITISEASKSTVSVSYIYI